MKKTCLITGGAGFIGSHLSQRLIEKDFRVIVFDNLITGREDNIRNLEKNRDFQFINQDICYKIKPQEKIDYIFHFASPASPIDYQKHPIETLLVNSIGTKNCLDLAKNNKAKIMFASTSEIYGDPLEHPQKESYWGNVNTRGARSCYDEAKRFGESIVYTYQNIFNINAVTIRIFNTYGPKMQKDDGRVISNFVNQAIRNNDITVNGKGKQTRSFCFVDDLIDGIVEIMFSGKSKGEVFNVGNPEEYSIIDIAKKIIEITKSNSKIVFNSLPEDDPKRRKPDISKIQSTIGWQPKITLTDGLNKTIKYFKSIK